MMRSRPIVDAAERLRPYKPMLRLAFGVLIALLASPVRSAELSAREAAARLSDARACEDAVRGLIDREEPKKAFLLMAACIDVGKFRDFELLLNAELARNMRDASPSLRAIVAAGLIAARGGDLEADMERMRARGIAMRTLEQALEQRAVAVGEPVLFLARMAGWTSNEEDSNLIRLEEMRRARANSMGASSLWDDAVERLPSSEPAGAGYEGSGWVVEAKLPEGGDAGLQPQALYLVMGTFEQVAIRPFDGEVVLMTLQRAHRMDARPPDLW